MLVAALLLALAAAPSGTCTMIEVVAEGRSGHSASPNPHSAPHRLVRGLAALERRHGDDFRIVELRGSEAPNVVPADASAEVELRDRRWSAGLDTEWRGVLGDLFDLVPLAEPCGREEADDG